MLSCFDSIGELEINNKTDSLIFEAGFGGDYWKEGKGPEIPSLDVIYIYQNVRDPERMKYKEFLETEFKNRFEDRPLSEYLEPAILSQIFASQ